MEIKHFEITKNILVLIEDINYNTPIILTYDSIKFNIHTRKYYKLYESTWKVWITDEKKIYLKIIKYFVMQLLKVLEMG